MKIKNAQRIINLVLKADAVGMTVFSIAMSFLPDVGDADTQITVLGIDLFALALSAL